MGGDVVTTLNLRTPFPWFGGKTRAAHLIWPRFGNTTNYVEPFFGGGAVLFNRPLHWPARVETVNDIDCYVANFWRALKHDPNAVAEWADYPVNEADLHARHHWLVDQVGFRERMKTDPDYWDAKIAGWWVYGLSQWIGSGWCAHPEWMGRYAVGAPRGVHTATERRRPSSCPTRKRPNLGGHNNKGVHRSSLALQIPDISGSRGATGRGVHRSGRESLFDWFEDLAIRLRCVRVCCGNWDRILGPSPTEHIGITAVLLDPPYEPTEIAKGGGRDGFSPTDRLYAEHESGLSAKVREWAIEHGDNAKLRIALCGYEGEHEMPESWDVVSWTSGGGYSNRGPNKRRNAKRERIWFSPHCLPAALPLFAREVSA
jgi:DNA adenine methylase